MNTLFQDLDAYYASLKQAREADEAVRRGAYGRFGGLMFIGVAVLFLSLIPIGPTVVWAIVTRGASVDVPGPVPDYFVYWAGGIIVGAAITFVGWAGGAAARGGYEFAVTSPEQDLFMNICGAREALQGYLLARQARDKRRAETLLEGLSVRYPLAFEARERYRPRERTVTYVEPPAFLLSRWGDVMYLSQRYPWIQLESDTRDVLDGLDLLADRLVPLVLEGKELQGVVEALGKLREFLYAYLPEHHAAMDGDSLAALRQAGLHAGVAYSRHARALPVVRADRARAELSAGPVLALGRAVLRGVQSTNPLVRFVTWFAVFAALMTVIVVPTAAALRLNADIAVPLCVSVTMLGAATLTLSTR